MIVPFNVGNFARQHVHHAARAQRYPEQNATRIQCSQQEIRSEASDHGNLIVRFDVDGIGPRRGDHAYGIKADADV